MSEGSPELAEAPNNTTKKSLRERFNFFRSVPKSEKSQPETSLERNGNTVKIRKGNKKFTVVYTNHAVQHDIQKEVSPNTNGIFLETSSAADHLASPEIALKYIGTQEASLVKDKKIPAYLIDVGMKDVPTSIAVITAEYVAIAFETGFGQKILAKVLKDIKEKHISRRIFIKGAAGLTAAAYLEMPMLSLIASGASQVTGKATNESSELMKLTNSTHPEARFITALIRNVAIAHKEDAIADKTQNPDFITKIGVTHQGIEDALMGTPEERLEFLKKTKPIWEKVIDPEYMYKLSKITHDGQNWHVENMEIPDLKELVNPQKNKRM